MCAYAMCVCVCVYYYLRPLRRYALCVGIVPRTYSSVWGTCGRVFVVRAGLRSRHLLALSRIAVCSCMADNAGWAVRSMLRSTIAEIDFCKAMEVRLRNWRMYTDTGLPPCSCWCLATKV